MLALRLFVSSLSRHPVAWRSASRQFSMAPGMVRREKTTQRLSWSKCSAQHVKLRQLSTEAEDLDKDEESNNGLELSDSCVERVLQVAGGEGDLLRITVEGGGCSGFQYKFELDNKVKGDDRIFKKGGAKVVIDELSLSFLAGSTVDYHQELIRSSFRIINNPKAELGCSCGASFSLK